MGSSSLFSCSRLQGKCESGQFDLLQLFLIFTQHSNIMSSAAKQRLQALSKQLVEGIPDEGTFEDIPKIRHVAPDSTGP